MSTSEGSNAQARLQELVAYPREELEIELKGWLDLTGKSNPSKESQADIGKAILALANHGGGYVLVGFEEAGGTWQPAMDRPSDLKQYSQDAINGIVHHFAEPVFHCNVHHVSHPEIRAPFPVIVVPGDHRTPIRSKAQGCNGKHIQMNCYYTRRPGPRSEQIQTGQEWDRLLDRCMRMRRDEVLAGLRSWLHGLDILPSLPGVGPRAMDLKEKDDAELARWAAEAEKRFSELAATLTADERPERYEYGVRTFAYSIHGEFTRPGKRELLDKMRQVEKHTGWPVWIIMNRADLKPYARADVIECWLKDTAGADPSTSDFWWASSEGRFFLLRGYDDDSVRASMNPGTVLDPVLQLWRAGECLLHASDMAQLLEVSEARIVVRATWAGLNGRKLRSWAGDTFYAYSWSNECRAPEVTSTIETTPEEISAAIPEVTERVLRPLYDAFDFFRLPMDIIDRELKKLKGYRF